MGGGEGEGEGGVAAMEEERVALHMGMMPDPEVVVHRILEAALLLSYRAMRLVEEGESGDEGF